MAINKKLIHFKNKQNFENEVANNNILDTSIVFIQDSKEISTHGTLYKTVNWSVLEDNSQDYSKEYFTIEALEDGLTASLSTNACEYSLDGNVWNSLSAEANTPTVNTGQKICFRGNLTPDSNNGIGTFTISNKCNVKGNIMSLLYGDDFIDKNDLTDKKFVFYRLFYKCTNIVDAFELVLPATTLASYCYRNMFQGCSSLTTAPELPATTLAGSCYYYMFYGCSSLTTAPKLPATILTKDCYYYMFSRCTSLTTAPALPATKLVEYCYSSMFKDCSKLNYITMLATDVSASNCLDNWVSGVSSTGTFVKNFNLKSLPNGTNGIPSDWEVKDHITPTECISLTITADDVIGNYTTTTIHYTAICNGIDYEGNTVTGFVAEGTAVSAEFPQNTSETETVEHTITFEFMSVTASTVITQGYFSYEKQYQYLTFEANENSTFKLTQNACQYSLDGGGTWVSLAAGSNTPTVTAGNKILFKCTNPSISNSYGIGLFSSTGKFNVEGNIMSMLYGDDFMGQTNLIDKNFVFYKLFYNCTNIVDAFELVLPATTLASSCYRNMFYGCKNLTTAPELPATTLASYCYGYMFQGCSSLTTAPELPATTLATYCYSHMFYGCSSLTTAPELLPATTLTNYCYQFMFHGCSLLTTTPVLPATELKEFCYSNMFKDCSKLNYITMLATDRSASNCLTNWVSGVASTGTFVKNKDMTTLPNGVNGIPSGWTVENV